MNFLKICTSCEVSAYYAMHVHTMIIANVSTHVESYNFYVGGSMHVFFYFVNLQVLH